jgi:hypothetical protein
MDRGLCFCAGVVGLINGACALPTTAPCQSPAIWSAPGHKPPHNCNADHRIFFLKVCTGVGSINIA